MTPHHSAQPLIGIALKVASTLAFTGMATLIKVASDRFPVSEISAYRSLFALIPVFVWVVWRDRNLRAVVDVFRTRRFGSHLVRSAIGACGMFLGFWALSLLPLADATAIGYAAPLLTVVFAAILLHEKVYIFRWTAVVVGLIGVLVMIAGYIGPAEAGHERSLFGALISLSAATAAALASTYTRSLVRYEHAATIVCYFSLLVGVFALMTIPLGWFWPAAAWVMPGFEEALILVGAGIFGGIGQVFLTQSYRYGDASTIAPFDYTSMIWVLIVSLVVFGTWPGANILIGTVIVIAAGLFVIWREHRLGIERARSKRAQTPTTPLS